MFIQMSREVMDTVIVRSFGAGFKPRGWDEVDISAKELPVAALGGGGGGR